MRKIEIKNHKIIYQVRRSRRSRYMRLSVSRDFNVIISLPWRFRMSLAEEFLRQKIDWVLEKLNYFEKNKTLLPRVNRIDYLKNKKTVRELVERRLEHFNSFYHFSWKKISVRCQKTRWGSCSQKGNLNFSYRIVFLPPELCDYIIVHELCHLGQFNHSGRFWELVGKTIPDYKKKKGIEKIIGLFSHNEKTYFHFLFPKKKVEKEKRPPELIER